jgi:hypothetical protein
VSTKNSPPRAIAVRTALKPYSPWKTAMPSAPTARAVSRPAADPRTANAAEIRELTRIATRKITPVQRLSWNITSPMPLKSACTRFPALRPAAAVASSRSSVWMLACGSSGSGTISSPGRTLENW